MSDTPDSSDSPIGDTSTGGPARPGYGPPPVYEPSGSGSQPGYEPQPGYGYGPQPTYGPGYGYGPQQGYGYGAQGNGTMDHPRGTTVLVLGILSLVLSAVCAVGVVLGPVAWIMGNNAIKEIDASPGRYANRGQVQAGRICGIVATALLVLGIVAVIGFVVFLVNADNTSDY